MIDLTTRIRIGDREGYLAGRVFSITRTIDLYDAVMSDGEVLIGLARDNFMTIGPPRPDVIPAKGPRM